MRFELRSFLDKMAWLATAFYFFAITAYINESWGRYVLLGEAALVLCLNILRNGATLRMRFNAWHGFFLMFIVYSILSAMWSINSADTIEKTVSLF